MSSQQLQGTDGPHQRQVVPDCFQHLLQSCTSRLLLLLLLPHELTLDGSNNIKGAALLLKDRHFHSSIDSCHITYSAVANSA
jgi:hypothetical protein